MTAALAVMRRKASCSRKQSAAFVRAPLEAGRYYPESSRLNIETFYAAAAIILSLGTPGVGVIVSDPELCRHPPRRSRS